MIRLRSLAQAASVLTHPLTAEDVLSLFDPVFSHRQLRGVVTLVVRETPNSSTIYFRPGRGWKAHEAGQWARIGVELDGVRHWRSYSLSAAAGQDPAITVTDAGSVSGTLVRETKPGDVLFLAPPQGDFTLPEHPRPLLMLTAGSGITPVMAMLRTMNRRGQLPDVFHVHSAPTDADVMFADELTQLHEEHDDFRCKIQLTRSQGKFALSSLDEVCPDWRERQTWACGPLPMLDEIETLWRDEGIENKLHLERFAVSRADTSGEGGTVTFAKADKTVSIDGATTLLEAGEQVGALMPFGCRMGICQTCVVPILAGHAIDLRSGKQHAEGDRVQTCISAAAGDCTLDA
ncbi:MAG: ferredoxin reductase [Arthrobacter sp.]|uniref:ferredoxin reductase n=1 Tax=Arthrobacter sp. TaxID=1667 RepID=UPI003499A8E9